MFTFDQVSSHNYIQLNRILCCYNKTVFFTLWLFKIFPTKKESFNNFGIKLSFKKFKSGNLFILVLMGNFALGPYHC